jgi:hypothetical protein
MRCLSCLYLEATYLKFCFKGHLYCLFGVILLSKSNIARQQNPQKPKLINTKNALLRTFLRNKELFWPQENHTKSSAQATFISPSCRTAELKAADHRQIPIDPVHVVQGVFDPSKSNFDFNCNSMISKR